MFFVIASLPNSADCLIMRLAWDASDSFFADQLFKKSFILFAFNNGQRLLLPPANAAW